MKALPVQQITLPICTLVSSVHRFPNDGIYFVQFDDHTPSVLVARMKGGVFTLALADPAIDIWNMRVDLAANRTPSPDLRTFDDPVPDPRFDVPAERQSIDVHRLFDQLIEHAKVMRNG